ncbi:glycosyltransferase family 4 protein [Cognaticolwellia beringensis]|uniref:Glycosyltransferase family 1 protein n=1 Tax=Cognaticolwellia beringensis TaxID=1967665 RepID=A0A222G7J9_9GAMM|nr:glycosyltransferase family 4 protein [Cognaticolwellia beringensis]ASP47886.1 glycosyltransferase family 1 protein [Cognaticolwellia beringensis]
MKIVIIGAYPNSIIGFRGSLISTFVRAGHEVIVMTAAASASVVADVTALGATFSPYPVERNGLNPFADIRTLFAIKKTLHLLQPDHVLAYTIKPIIWGGIASRMIGFKNFHAMITGLGYAFEKGAISRNLINFIVKRLYKYSLAKVKSVIFQNQDNRKLFIELDLVESGKCYRVFGSGVDINEYQQQPLPRQETTFLLIARLLGDKGIREFASAAKMVKQRYPEAKFQLLGPYDSSPDKISIAEVTQWQNEGHIQYLGETDNVKAFIQACHIYTLPSYHEGLPRTVLEAMSMGRPILTTDATGCRDTVINGENGWLVPTRNADALANRMMWFIEHPEQWQSMADKSRHMVEDKFDDKQVNKAIGTIIGI